MLEAHLDGCYVRRRLQSGRFCVSCRSMHCASVVAREESQDTQISQYDNARQSRWDFELATCIDVSASTIWRQHRRQSDNSFLSQKIEHNPFRNPPGITTRDRQAWAQQATKLEVEAGTSGWARRPAGHCMCVRAWGNLITNLITYDSIYVQLYRPL